MSCLTVELANIGVICAAADTIDIVFNFIALAIIAEFDNYVFGSMKNESFKELCTDEFARGVLKITHTSSKKCDPSEPSKVRYVRGDLGFDETDPQKTRPMRITLLSRHWKNKILFILYKLLRMFYVSCFYYFLPFSVVVFSTLIPLMYRNFYKDLPACN